PGGRRPTRVNADDPQLDSCRASTGGANRQPFPGPTRRGPAAARGAARGCTGREPVGFRPERTSPTAAASHGTAVRCRLESRNARRVSSDSEQAFAEARAAWRAALREHVLAPPDAGFSARLAALAAAAKQRAAACEAAYRDGFEWPPARGGAKPPYELQPGTGRRGPQELWERFDEAVA